MTSEQDGSNAPSNKRKGFDISRCAVPAPKKQCKVPKASSLMPGYRFVCPPSADVSRKLGAASLAMGFDIETHDLVGPGGGGSGRFGHPWRSNPSIFQLRLVQIGWAIGGCAMEDPITSQEERLVKPQGFQISKMATEKHGINNEHAQENGLLLSDALEEFMQAAWQIHESGGIVVSHHIEFDAGIIDEELDRCGMQHWRLRWREIAIRGVCTMDPDIQSWMQYASGKEKEPGEKSLVMNLTRSIKLFFQHSARVQDLLMRSHTAGADAEMHLLLYRALRDLAQKEKGQAKPGLSGAD